MKAPAKVENYLLDQGFVYKFSGYWKKEGNLIQHIKPEKDSEGFVFNVNLLYPISEEDALSLAPSLLLDGVHASGYIDGDFSRSDSHLDPKDTNKIIEFLNIHVKNHLKRLMDSELMVRVYQYLRGKSRHDKEVVKIFPVIADFPPKDAPIYFMSLAAYLNLLGRFDEAKEYLSLIKYTNGFKSKLLLDAENKWIKTFEKKHIFGLAKHNEKKAFEGIDFSQDICAIFLAKNKVDLNSDNFLLKIFNFKKAKVGNWLVYMADINQILGCEEKITEKFSFLSENAKLFMRLTQSVTGTLWFEYYENGNLKRKWLEIEGKVQSNIGTPLPEEVDGLFTSDEDENGERDEWSIVEVSEKITGIKWEMLINL